MKIRVTPAIRQVLCPYAYGARLYAAADEGFKQLYLQARSAREVAQALGWLNPRTVNVHRVRLGLPPKGTRGGRNSRRLKNPIAYRGKIQPFAAWVHELYTIPAGETNRILVICYNRMRRGNPPHKIFAPIAGIPYKEEVQ